MTDASPLHGKRILIVEDDFYLAMDHSDFLKRCGATIVDCTADPRQASDLIAAVPIDAALVDINLGLGPSFDTARRLRERKVPFLFATGYDERTIPDEFRDIVRIEKPHDEDSLLAALRRIL